MKLQQRKTAGFTLIELMIVVAIIAIIASVAIPKLLSARLSANESAAISTLRSISSAQAQLQSSAAIDTDSDGSGEYGFFGELAGVSFIREDDGSGAPAVSGTDRLTPAMLSAALGNVDGNGQVQRSGYIFQMYLSAGAGVQVPEGANGGMGGATDPDDSEIYWCCYAWPIDAGGTGNRAFFINQDGDMLQFNNRAAGAFAYDGNVTAVPATAAYSGAGTMDLPTANAGANIAANDGNNWVVVQ